MSRGNSSCQGTPWVSSCAAASAITASQSSNSSSGLAADLDLGQGERRPGLVEGSAEHVLEGLEPVAALGEQLPEAGIGEVRQLHLGRRVSSGEPRLDRVELLRRGDAVEPDPGHLVVRRAVAGVARHSADDRDQEAAVDYGVVPQRWPRRSGPPPRARSDARARCRRTVMACSTSDECPSRGARRSARSWLVWTLESPSESPSERGRRYTRTRAEPRDRSLDVRGEAPPVATRGAALDAREGSVEGVLRGIADLSGDGGDRQVRRAQA